MKSKSLTGTLIKSADRPVETLLSSRLRPVMTVMLLMGMAAQPLARLKGLRVARPIKLEQLFVVKTLAIMMG